MIWAMGNIHKHINTIWGIETMEHDMEHVDVCATSGIIELCDFCDNVATQSCPICDASICNDHIIHKIPSKRTRITIDKFDDTTVELHLTRYIANRDKRTGGTWRVVERYMTNDGGRFACTYMRAIITDDKTTVRIFYRMWNWARA